MKNFIIFGASKGLGDAFVLIYNVGIWEQNGFHLLHSRIRAR